jgi:hypothetical protein
MSKFDPNNPRPFKHDKPQVIIRNIIQERKISMKDLGRLFMKAFVDSKGGEYVPHVKQESARDQLVMMISGSRRFNYKAFRLVMDNVFNEPIPDDQELNHYLKLNGRIKDLLNKKFGRLTVIAFEDVIHNRVYWRCKCECGGVVVKPANSLRNGDVKSCGCLPHDMLIERNTIHGMSKTSIYTVWCSMIQRCTDKNHKRYNDYGGRGITVCDRWLNSFENFYKDMGDRPEGTTMDRIDNDGNYEPGNCRWATSEEQNNNTRMTLRFKDGTPITPWGRTTGLCNETVRRAYHAGYQQDDILAGKRGKHI